MRVLCVYATRQIDSNLFMSSTKFDGLQKCGYHVDMIFCGTEAVCKQFESRYSHYFNNVYYILILLINHLALRAKIDLKKVF